ncbi:hypothetical protein AVEN_132910-1, partial [Araneus ventricosus]
MQSGSPDFNAEGTESAGLTPFWVTRKESDDHF